MPATPGWRQALALCVPVVTLTVNSRLWDFFLRNHFWTWVFDQPPGSPLTCAHVLTHFQTVLMAGTMASILLGWKLSPYWAAVMIAVVGMIAGWGFKALVGVCHKDVDSSLIAVLVAAVGHAPLEKLDIIEPTGDLNFVATDTLFASLVTLCSGAIISGALRLKHWLQGDFGGGGSRSQCREMLSRFLESLAGLLSTCLALGTAATWDVALTEITALDYYETTYYGLSTGAIGLGVNATGEIDYMVRSAALPGPTAVWLLMSPHNGRLT